MLQRKTAELFEEPACAVNRAKTDRARKAGCGKSLQPGAAAGGCAFDGSKIALQPIADAAHLVHGPIGCEGNSWDSRHTESSGPMLYRTGLTTDLSELEIVHGGERKLYRAIGEIAERWHPPAIFVYQTCVTAMIGDDLAKVCARAQEAYGLPVIPVVAPGFVGSKNFGNKLAGETLLAHVIGTEEPEETTPYDFALLGEYNIAGELWQVQPLFDRLGLRLLSSITGDGRYRAVAAAHRARVSMVVCSQALVTLARKLQERYGIPYFEGSFYGIAETSASLRRLSALLVERGAPAELLARTEALVAAEETRAAEQLAPYRARLQGRRVLLYTGGVKSWSVITALHELGMEVVATSVRKATDEDRERVRERMGADAPMVDQIPAREMYRQLKAGEADMLMSGGRTQFIALKAGVPWLDINQERHTAYAGYEGMIALAQAISLAVESPIWAQVRRPAPWDPDTGMLTEPAAASAGRTAQGDRQP